MTLLTRWRERRVWRHAWRRAHAVEIIDGVARTDADEFYVAIFHCMRQERKVAAWRHREELSHRLGCGMYLCRGRG